LLAVYKHIEGRGGISPEQAPCIW